MASSAARQRDTAQYRQAARPASQQGPRMELLPENQQVRRRAPAKIPYGKYAVIGVFIFAVSMVILIGYTKMTELTAQNTALKEELTELQSEENALNADKEKMFNLTYVEERALAMGMVKQSSAQVTYVDLSNPERSAMAAEEKGESSSFLAGLVKTFNAVVEYLN